MKVVIVGGVAGGATAAARLRRLDEHAEIIMIERTGYVSYANCGLPYYIGGSITDKQKLTLQTPESFKNRFNVDARVNQEVIAINREEMTVDIRDLVTGNVYTESYDKLILSPGARAVIPRVPGVDLAGVYSLRTVEDTFEIHRFIEEQQPKSAVVVGAGFIGLEMAENLVERGLKVSILQRPDHVMNTVDADMASFLHENLRRHGIDLYLEADMTGITDTEDGLAVSFGKKGENTDAPKRTIKADMVVLAIGVTPETHLAEEAGLELGLKHTIVVDEHMRTSDPHIFAVGDAVQVKHMATGYPAVISLAGPANKQGRVAADTICGLDHEFAGSMGSSILKLFDMTVASTGLNSKAAEAAGLAFDYVVITSPSHATYYPGAKPMTVKVLYDTDTFEIIGGQIVGCEGVDKRIDVLAMAIFAGLDCYDLADLDLAYAPPFSSAKDPVNVAGYVIQNICDGILDQVHWSDVERDFLNPETKDDNVVLLDTRRAPEFEMKHVEGALNIPVDALRDRISELPQNKRIYVYCKTGLRSYVACRMLAQHGFDVRNVSGGFAFYSAITADHMMRETGVGPCGETN